LSARELLGIYSSIAVGMSLQRLALPATNNEECENLFLCTMCSPAI